MPEVKLLFPKLLYANDLNISDAYNNEIKQEIIKILDTDDTSHPYSASSFNNNKVDCILKNPVFAPLLAMIRENICSFCKEINFNNELRINDIWVSITHPGKYHDIHSHGSSTVLSGVYYVQTEPTTTLEFIGDTKLGIPFHEEQLNSKKLLLFDGSLVHGFTHVNLKEPKITIAFNCVLIH